MLTCSLHRDLHTWSSCWSFSGVWWGGNSWERRSHTFLHYIETWLRSHKRDSDTQTRTARQGSTVKQGNPVWKFLQAAAHFIRIIWCRLLRRAATTLPRLTAPSCSSRDQCFDACNAFRSKSFTFRSKSFTFRSKSNAFRSKSFTPNAALNSNTNGKLRWITLSLLK